MKRVLTYIIIVTVAMVAGAMTDSSAWYSSNRRPPRLASQFNSPSSAEDPQLSEVELQFKGQPVDQVVFGKKAKKYSITLTGTGFVPDSIVIVDSLRAYPYALIQSDQHLDTVFKDSTRLRTTLNSETVSSPGFLAVKVANPGGGESNSLAIDVISKPSELSIASISPESGPIGTKVTLTGTGFTSTTLFTGTSIRFGGANADQPLFIGFYVESPTDTSSDLYGALWRDCDLSRIPSALPRRIFPGWSPAISRVGDKPEWHEQQPLVQRHFRKLEAVVVASVRLETCSLIPLPCKHHCLGLSDACHATTCHRPSRRMYTFVKCQSSS